MENRSHSHIIDVHSHYFPPPYLDAMRKAGKGKIDGWAIPAWSVDDAFAAMETYGVTSQILSIGTPGLDFVNGREQARSLARELNEYGASLIQTHPSRFGAHAVLPLTGSTPDIDGALDELAYALDTLQLDGVALLSNYDGLYLGSPRLDPLFDELNRRSAVVFVHPNRPPNFEPISVGLTPSLVEYPFDSTRMAVNLLRTGTIERCPDIKLIVAHGGGTIPFLHPRLGIALGPERAALLASFYYDMTAATLPGQVAALTEFAKPDRLLMGFDFPFMRPAMNVPFLAALKGPHLSDEQRSAILNDNPLRLFPRLAQRLAGS